MKTENYNEHTIFPKMVVVCLFDITDYVENGENIVVVKVRKWCSGSYLEDQYYNR